MEVEYKKDLRHNYMIIRGLKDDPLNTYSIKLLEHQRLKGILSLEKKIIDNEMLYYYEITGKQTLEVLLCKDAFQYKRLRTLCYNIIKVLEDAYEYLLREEDFIISQEHIYMDIISKEYNLCYLPGYGKGIREQICSLMESLMNKVDYNDREAVLLVYRLYSISREESFTLNQMLQELQEKNEALEKKEEIKVKEQAPPIPIIEPQTDETWMKENKIIGTSINEALAIDKKLIPVMKERIEGEEEVVCYPLKAYLYAGISYLLVIALIIFALSSNLLFNKYANQYDYTKLIAFVLILLCVEGYVTTKIFDKKKRITKIKRTCSYIDPRQEDNEEVNLNHNLSEAIAKKSQVIKTLTLKLQNAEAQIPEAPIIMKQEELGESYDEKILKVEKERLLYVNNVENMEQEEDLNPTCVLNGTYEPAAKPCLKAMDDQQYEDVILSSSPFFVGKLKKTVDYCLEKEGISRFHAKITKEGEQYYLTDLNSTNGTFINKEALQIYQRKEIKDGDKITFANIEYKFVK